MKSPLELLKETHLRITPQVILETLKKCSLKLFSLEPKEALKLKAKTISLLRDLPANKYQQLVHQIAQQRRINENFLTWLDYGNCPCEECEENKDYE